MICIFSLILTFYDKCLNGTVKTQLQDCGGSEQMISRDPTDSDSLSLRDKIAEAETIYITERAPHPPNEDQKLFPFASGLKKVLAKVLSLVLHYSVYPWDTRRPWTSHSTSLIFGNCSQKVSQEFSLWNI